MNKYLSQTWYRAGIPVQLHDDSSQAVYATLLQNLGRGRFDALVARCRSLGRQGCLQPRDLRWLGFFRAVDMVKKRAQRERRFTNRSIRSTWRRTPRHEDAGRSLAHALQEAIEQTLSPREAALIHDTLMGKTPAEIATQWGVAPKTVSNEKSRVLQKLRSALADYEMN